MAVENNKVNETFAMNGILLTFSVTNMRVIDRDTVKAYIIDNTIPAAPVKTTLVLDGAGATGYAVTLVTDDSFNVVVNNARNANFELVVYRELEILQESDYTDYGKFPAETVEDDFDKGILIDQQLGDLADRALKFDIDIDLGVVSTILPSPAADSVLGWNAGLTALENKPDLQSQVDAAEAAQAAAELAQAAAEAAQAAALASQNAASVSAAAALVSQNAAAVSAAAALVSENNAETAETNAELAETNAETAETNAAASAAAALAYATQLVGTSTTSVLVGTGAKVFTTQTGKFFNAGNFLLITSDANPANFMHGQVTSYVGTTLTMSITDIGGAGTFNDWTIRLSGTQGADGANSDFLSLSDTPNTYVGASLFKVRVNAAETALEFVADTGGGSGGGKVFSALLMGG